MKKLVTYLAKRYALAAVKDAVAAHGPEVSAWAARVGGWLARARLVVAFLERLADRLGDGALTDAEAGAIVNESVLLAQEVTRA
jgi:hypothetical protein